MCILELSKVLMYEFHYDYIENKYGSNSKLLLIVYCMKLKDIYEDFNTRVIVAASSSPPVSRVKIVVTKIAVTSSINQMLI